LVREAIGPLAVMLNDTSARTTRTVEYTGPEAAACCERTKTPAAVPTTTTNNAVMRRSPRRRLHLADMPAA
jgi:hypothetical protein